MTCIVAVKAGGGVWMGGDSAGCAGCNLTIRDDAKVFQNGPYLIGYTSSFRMGQILRYAELPRPEGSDLHRFMCTTFVDRVRALFREGGYMGKDKERDDGGTFLVGVAGEVFEVNDDFQVGIPANGIAACGCGAQVALGAVTAISGTPAKRIRKALEITEQYSAAVRGPFVVARLARRGKQ